MTTVSPVEGDQETLLDAMVVVYLFSNMYSLAIHIEVNLNIAIGLTMSYFV